MESLWREQVPVIKAKKASGDIYRDVIVVGAGLTGVLTAFYLQESGKRVLVLEAKAIGSGQTERTTAKITSQHDLKYSKLIQKIGEKKARLYAEAQEHAVREYEKLIQKRKIDCQFKKASAYLYTCQDETPLRKEAEAAQKLGIDACFTKETELPFPISGAVCFPNQAHFSPLEFLRDIASELEIREYTKVTAVKGNQVITEGQVFTAEKIVIASHFPLRNVPGFYFVRQHQERSYVLALSGAKQMQGMYLGTDSDGLSFRQAGDFLLLGGSSVRTGENTTCGAYEALQAAAEQYFPGCRIEKQWAAQDCMPHDGIPFIGKYSVFTPNLYVATGFQKWGMTSAMVGAQLLRDEICGKENPYAKLFSPQRMNIRAGIGNWCLDMGESVKGLFKGLLGKKTLRCPHMGCELIWNPEEKSWDCPCHGSRFDENGDLLDNPAKKDMYRE